MQGFLKESGIYFDTKPKKGSNNAVTSDGIFKAIQEGGGGSGYDDTELRQRINANSNNIDRLDGKTSTIENNLTQAETDIETLETSVSNKASISSVSALSDRVTQAETDIETLETSVSNKASISSVSALSDRVTQAETDIETLETSVSGIGEIYATSNFNQITTTKTGSHRAQTLTLPKGTYIMSVNGRFRDNSTTSARVFMTLFGSGEICLGSGDLGNVGLSNTSIFRISEETTVFLDFYFEGSVSANAIYQLLLSAVRIK